MPLLLASGEDFLPWTLDLQALSRSWHGAHEEELQGWTEAAYEPLVPLCLRLLSCSFEVKAPQLSCFRSPQLRYQEASFITGTGINGSQGRGAFLVAGK